MSDTNSSLINEFLVESFENLSNISEELTQFEKDAHNLELLNSVYRKVHTLKGSASFLGFKKLQEITHQAETILDRLRENELELTGDITDVLLETFDSCVEILKQIEASGAEGEKEYSNILGDLKGILSSGGEPEIKKDSAGSDESNIDNNDSTSAPKKKILKKVLKRKVLKKVTKSETASAEAPVAQVAKTDLSSESEDMKKEVVAEKNTPMKKDKVPSTASIADSVVRVNVQLLDKIMNVVGELVLNRNQILQSVNNIENSELTRLSQQLNVITTELQTDIMQTRMQPVGAVVNKFERVVRDLARAQNKKINLVITGQDTELDKTLLEAIRDPLTHLIRNSVDHGIEMPEERKAKGKPEVGNIQIKAYHEGGQVNIEIIDDGGGIDAKKIAAKAIEKGLVTQEEITMMNERQIMNLIFKPGFSTAEQVTNISGRGVGMDVVKSNIEKIGGNVDIDSKVGLGSVFKLKIPLTLAIIPALIIKSCDETFAIPQLNLVELVRLDAEHADKAIEHIYKSEFFRLRGDLIPIFRLNKELELEKISQRSSQLLEVYKNSNKMDKLVTKSDVSDILEDDCLNIVVLRAEGVTFGLIVDTVLDTEEIVVKPLSQMLREKTCFAGATIMGDGSVALILDALGFFNRVSKGNVVHANDTSSIDNRELCMERFADDDQEILMIELADGKVYGLPLILVNRLEKFNANRVEWAGEQAIVRYGDVPMPLINLEENLQLSIRPDFAQLEENQTIPCIVVKLKGLFYGLVVKSIVDIAVSEGNINSDAIDHEGLLGTVFVGDKTITLIDVHGILGKVGANSTKHSEHKKTLGKSRRILLVEDSPLYRKIESEFLLEFGYSVETANDGAEALELLKNDSAFDLIITDIEMPVMNGFEFCRELRTMDQFRDIPVLAVSTKVQDKDFEMGREVGFNEHLEKLNKDEVLGKIEEYLQGL